MKKNSISSVARESLQFKILCSTPAESCPTWRQWQWHRHNFPERWFFLYSFHGCQASVLRSALSFFNQPFPFFWWRRVECCRFVPNKLLLNPNRKPTPFWCCLPNFFACAGRFFSKQGHECAQQFGRWPCFNYWSAKYLNCRLSLATLEMLFFPKAAAKGSFKKSVVIKDCHSGLSSNIAQSKDCHEGLSSNIAQSYTEVMAVFKDCHQTSPKVLLKWWLSLKIVIKHRPKFYWSDGCL